MEFGKSLREAREAKGYTVSQIAEMTHLKSAVVEGLESEDFSMIAAPIYGRGFVKLYCEAVGLETKPFVDEFMEIMNGNRDVAIKERPVAEPAQTQDIPPPPPPPAERDLFSQEPTIPEPPPVADPLHAAAPQADISRYASPFRAEEPPPPSLPVLPWRIILLAVAGLALLALLVFGIRALYCATSSDHAAEARESVEVEAPAAPKAAPKAESKAKPETKSAPRTQQKIPSLYID